MTTTGPPSPRPLLVLGSPRSGTTLVGNYLGSSASVLNLVEYSGFYLSYLTVPREYAQGPCPYKDRYLADVRRHARSFADRVATEEGRPYFCDCTPWNLLVLAELAADLDDAVVVLVVRDYRGVITSLGRSYQAGHPWAGATLRARAEQWSRFYANARFLPPGRSVVVSYDRLVATPATALEELKEAVGGFGIDTDSLDETQLAVSHATLEPRPTIGRRAGNGRVVLVAGNPNHDLWTPEMEAEVWPVVGAVRHQLEQQFPGVLPLSSPTALPLGWV